jgi:hypothetical protein
MTRATWIPTPRWFATRVRDHWERVRREGFGRVLQGDVVHASDAIRSYRWGLVNRGALNAVPVYIVGIQRSGTDMLIEAFRRCPEVEAHNESRDSRAFHGFKLRGDAALERLIRESRHRCIVFKSLCDSHRVIHLVEGLDIPTSGRAIWVFRSMEGRVRSTLAKWPENNRRVLREIAAGRNDHHWEAGGLSDERLDLVRSFDYEEMTPESGAALLWYVRNALYYDLGLNGRSDVALVSYEQMLGEPQRSVKSLCQFLSLSYHDRMTRHIGARPPATSGSLDIDPIIRARCSELEARFAAEIEVGSSVPAGSLPV